MLGSDDGATAYFAFGRNGGVADGSSVSTGVFDAHGARLLAADTNYVAGGYSRVDGHGALLLKDAGDPTSNTFEISHLDGKMDKVVLTEWDGEAKSIAMLGPWVLWVTSSNQLKARSAWGNPKDAPIDVATLPGPIYTRHPPYSACRTKSGMFIGLRTRADGIGRIVVLSATDSALGKTQVTDDGDLYCTDDAALVVSNETVTTCTDAGCNGTKLERSPVPEALAPVGSTLVRASRLSGLLRIVWEKDGKPVATKVYDAQMKGTVLLGESKLGHLEVLGRRDYGLVLLDIAGTQHLARVDATGGITPVAFKP
jgi:hypothetical protein